MEKRSRDTSRKRDLIIKAATAVFGEEGLDAASMDRIAERAEVSKRTVYNHFLTKIDLFKAVVDAFVHEMSGLKQTSYDPKQPLFDQLERFADAELSLATNPTWLRFTKVLLVAMIREPLLAQELHQNYKGGGESLFAWISAAVADKRLRVDDIESAAAVFNAMIGGAFTWPAVYMGFVDETKAQALKRELIETFLSRYSLGINREL